MSEGGSLDQGIWILAEHCEGRLEEVTLEILMEARRLANKRSLKVSALLLGHGVGQMAELLPQWGADFVYWVDDPMLADYTTEAFAMAVAEVVRMGDPSVLLLPATAMGRDLAPRLAARLDTTLVSDCVVLDINEQGLLEMTRAPYGGRLYATITAPRSRPQMATVRPGVLGKGRHSKGRKGIVRRIEVALAPMAVRTKILGFARVEREELDISEAEVILAFGRGLGDKERLPHMEELARLLGAALGGSRASVDAGWIPFSRQIGQTGKTVSPDLIICCGISGASQFTMGMKDSKFIVAINLDRHCPMFKVADVCILGDMHQIVPALIERLASVKGRGGPKG